MGNTPLHLIFLLSGLTALGFQLCWTRMLALGIGHELGSVLAVISAFFGGVTLGAWLLDKPIARSRHPGYWYAALEGAIGLWGALSLLAIPLANRFIFRWTGLDSPDFLRWTICFLVAFLSLLPATFCMGATLPAMERTVAAMRVGSRPIPGLYAANTLGAVAGVFAAVFVFSPSWGYQTAILIFSGLAAACSLSAFLLARSATTSGVANGEKLLPLRPDPVLATLFFTGLFGIGYEVVCTRALAQYFEDSVYTYAALLVVYLSGTALGAFAYPKISSLAGDRRTPGVLLAALLFTCLTGTALLPAVGALNVAIGSSLGDGRIAQLLGEVAAAALVFFLPTLCMGAVFSHLAQAAREKSLGLGRALALNTLGGALAPFLFGIVLLPAVGIRNTLLVIGLGYALFIRPFKAAAIALAVALAPLTAALAFPWNPADLPPGSRLLEYREGAMSSVAAIENEDGKRSLRVDNRFHMGGTLSEATERLKVHIPLLLHPRPGKVLFIGLGTGVTFGAVADHRIDAADAVELDPVVAGMLPHFAPQNRHPYPARYRLFKADARRFIRAAPDAYDVVIADFFHPNRDGAASLYTREHFRAIQARLDPGGIFCQWLPLYQLDMLSLRIIVRTFLQVFPHAQAYLGNFNAELPGLALVGAQESRFYPADWFSRRVDDPAVGGMLAQEGVSDGFSMASFFLASHEDLEAIAGDAPPNTDNHPRVMFINPGFEGLAEYTTYGRLESLLDGCRRPPADLAGNGGDSASLGYREDLGRLLAARDIYLRGAIAEARGNGNAAVAQYLRSAEISRHFTVGYAKCLILALEQGQADPAWAKGILHRLAEMRPDIEDARTVLREAFNE